MAALGRKGPTVFLIIPSSNGDDAACAAVEGAPPLLGGSPMTRRRLDDFANANAAAATPTTPSAGKAPCPRLVPLAFRSDINEAQARAAVRRDREMARYASTLADWQGTCASIKDHKWMARALAVEAFRYRQRTSQPLRRRDLAVLLATVGHEEAAISRQNVLLATAGSPTLVDPYVNVMRRLEALRIFQPIRSTSGSLVKQFLLTRSM